MKGRALVRAAFARRPVPRPPFIPLIGAYAAGLAGYSPQEASEDPTLQANSLERCQKLFGYDGITTWFDLMLVAEACGCGITWPSEQVPQVASHVLPERTFTDAEIAAVGSSGRLAASLEASRRLRRVLGDQAGMVAVVPGPVTLALQLRGGSEVDATTLDLAGRVVVAVVKRFCEAFAPDGVWLVEDCSPQLAVGDKELGAVLRPVFNSCRFYDSSPIVFLRQATPTSAELWWHMGAAGLCVGTGVGLAEVQTQAQAVKQSYGVALPLWRAASTDEIGTAVKAALSSASPGLFLTTNWEVPAETEAEVLHNAVQLVMS